MCGVVDSVEGRVLCAVNKYFHIKPWLEKACCDDKLVADLGLDSLERVELVAMLEREFEVDIPEDATNVATVGDVVECVKKVLLAQV